MNFQPQLHTNLAPKKADTETVRPQNSYSSGWHPAEIHL